VQFQTRIQQPSASEPANASSTGMIFYHLFLKDQHWHLPLIWYSQKKHWWIILWISLFLIMQAQQELSHPLKWRSHPHQGPSHPLLEQRYQLHQRWTPQSN
jgi:hypothetical protein